MSSSTTPEIDIDMLEAGQASATVIDVREPAEYVAGHVPGARLVPMGQLASRVEELDRSRRVYVVCASGNRSAAMTDLLVARGFDAYSVAGQADWCVERLAGIVALGFPKLLINLAFPGSDPEEERASHRRVVEQVLPALRARVAG